MSIVPAYHRVRGGGTATGSMGREQDPHGTGLRRFSVCRPISNGRTFGRWRPVSIITAARTACYKTHRSVEPFAGSGGDKI